MKDENFKYLTLVNSKSNLSRKLEYVETTEASDVYNFIKPHTFLITTAMIYQENQLPLIDLIEILAKFPITCLAIKINRFLGYLDPRVIDAAKKYDFPILIIPESKTIGEVYQEVSNFIMDNKDKELSFAFEVHQKFYNLAINNASSKDLIDSLSHLINKPILLVDPFGNIQENSSFFKPSSYKSLLRKVVENISQNKLKNSKDLEAIKYPINSKYFFKIYPIKISKHYPYFLFILNEYTTESKSSEELAIHQGILVLAFLLFKNLRIYFTNLIPEEVKLTKIKNMNENDIFNSSLDNIGLEIHRNSKYQAVLISLAHNKIPIQNYSFSIEHFVLVYEWLSYKLRNNKGVYIYPDKSNLRIALIYKDKDIDIENFILYQNITNRTLGLDLFFGVGKVFKSPLNLKDSLFQAEKALENGVTKENIDFIKYYKTLNIFELITSLDRMEIESFIYDNLKELAKPKNKYQRELRDTLKIYLNYNCDASLTAKKLFIHRNTVLYRIEKCQEILGNLITENKVDISLLLSLKLVDFLENNK